MFNKIIAGATNTEEGNSIAYIMGLPDKLPVQKEDNNKPIMNNTQQKKNGKKLVDNASSSSNSQKTTNNPSKGHYGATNGLTPSVGVSKNTINANSDSDPDNSDEGSSDNNDGKSYEISRKGTDKQINSNNIIFAIVIILILGAIVGYGYIRSNRKE